MKSRYRLFPPNRFRVVGGCCLCLILLILLQAGSVAGSPLEGSQELRPDTEAVEVVHLFWHEAVGGPAALGTESIGASALGLSEKEAQDPEQVAQTFLQTYGAKLHIAKTANQWNPIRTEVDSLGNHHVFLQQTYTGLRIFAGEVAVHINKGAITAANGEYLSTVEMSTKPALSVEAAYKFALTKLGLESPALLSSQLTVFNPALLDLGTSANHLAYHLIIGDKDSPASQTVFVDAHTGKLLLRFNNLRSGKNRDIRDLNGSENLPGSRCYTESGPVGSPSADCINAFNFSGNVYDYYLDTHGRDSFDNSGATMLTSVRYGTEANAFWDGSQTAFGPGFATKDVVAHEWTHAVTQYTADLIYAYQPGALNESMSDIFGAMVDRDDWLMGEDTPIGALRSLADPTTFGDPGKVGDSQFYCGDGDNGGVHINSGVPNHTAYLMAEGGTYNSQTVTGIGRDDTERIFYRALTAYLTGGSSFGDAYNALISACGDLFGSGSGTCTNVTTAAQATEMDQPVCGGGGSGTPDDYEPDDTAAEASTIAVDGSSQTHNFHDVGDNDWVQFSATAGTNYVIETFNLGGGSDTYMYLYDTDATTIVAQDDDGGTGYASRIEWAASSGGTYYVRVHHYNGGTFGNNTDYNLRVTSDGSGGSPGDPDAFEPDDTPGQASAITVNGSAQTHNFHVAGDDDWAQFSATAGDGYTIETFNLGSESDTVLELYDTDGTTLLASNDDGGEGRASRIEWTASSNGTYYVRVRHYNTSVFGANTNYDLRVTTGGVTPDSFEPDDTFGQASTITVSGSTQTHNFHVAGDSDWAQFAATAGCSYVIETLSLGSGSDTVLDLYDTDGTTLLASDDDSGDGYASRMAWTAPANGVYYARVRHASSSTYGGDTNYDLRVTSAGCGGEGDIYEPDDTFDQASTITVDGSGQTHNFHDAGDEDWVQFATTTGLNYVIETLNLGSDSDTFLELYETDGATLIAADDDGGTGRASRIAWTAPADGTYYIRVRHYDGSVYGPGTSYDLSATSTGTPGDPDAYEPDDTFSQASTITVNGDPQTHNFHDAGDEDWAEFSATTGTNYAIETLNLGSRSDTVLELFDTDGATLIAEDDNGGTGAASRIAWTAPADGVYFARVRHSSSDTFGANTEYDLRLTSASAGGADAYEPDDSSGQASTIAVDGSAQTHNFHVAGDEDWVEFSATSGTAYTIRTFNLGPNSDTYLELYDTDASTMLDSNDDGGGGLASRITWTPPSFGVYYVSVRHYFSDASGSDTNYDLEVVSSGSGDGDTYEPDDISGQASIITVDGSSQRHNFHYAGDQDWVQFTATGGVSYVIKTFNLGNRSDTYMYLYDTDTTTIIDQDDDSGPGLGSRIAWIAPADGTYYVRVHHYNSNTYGQDTRYDLRVTSTSADCDGGDSYEPDNVPGQASTITVNGTVQTHDFHCRGDQDWVQFSATGATIYVIETFNLGFSSDTVLELYDTDGSTLIDEDDDGGDEGLASRIFWIAPADGTYYVRVRDFWEAYGPDTSYDLSVTTLVMLGGNPKIDSVQPTSLANDTDTVISLTGSGFMNTPKVNLRTGNNEIPLAEVTFDNSTLVWATVPAGTKAGIYKVQLVNTDDSGAEFSSGIIIATGCYDFDAGQQPGIDDVQVVAGRWRNPAVYDARYDVVFDGVINIQDIMQVATSWGQTCSTAAGVSAPTSSRE